MLDCAIIMKALNHSHNYFLSLSIDGIRDKSDSNVELFKIFFLLSFTVVVLHKYLLLLCEIVNQFCGLHLSKWFQSFSINFHSNQMYAPIRYLIVTNYKLLCKENLFRHYVMLRIDNHHVSVITLWQHKKYFLISNTISLPKMSEFCRSIIA